MSNIDKRALREAAEKHGNDDILALLDELEAKDNRINRLEAIVAVAEQRNAIMREWKRVLRVPCDLIDDQVPVVIHSMVIRLERLKEAEAKLEAAEKRIADQRGIIASARKFISEYAGLGDVGAAEFIKIIDRAAAGKGE
ncbi:TPA: hypothetical protein ONC12_003154 [Enterobacter hormaechei subsp. steigerwaltii]|nr:hypothetical protein [Enterobacter hormaechei subsp. steigerwaltii]